MTTTGAPLAAALPTLTPGALPGERGCGASRVAGGIYAEYGIPEQDLYHGPYLMDPAQPVPATLDLEARGVRLIQRGTTWHLVDWVGAEFYPNVEDFLAECLLPDEWITTEDGLTPIRDIKIGDRVLTHRGRYRPVTATMSRPYTGDVVRVLTAYSPSAPLRLTPEHPVLRAHVLRGRERFARERRYGTEVLDRSFVPARDLRVDDYVCFPILSDERDVESVDLSYTRRYRRFYRHSVRSEQLEDAARALRGAIPSDVRAAHHRLLHIFARSDTWTLREVMAVRPRVYAREPHDATALTVLARRGYVERVCRGTYRITREGGDIAAQPYQSYRSLAATLRVSERTAFHLRQPPRRPLKAVSRTIPVDEHLMRLCGYYLAEGSPYRRRPEHDQGADHGHDGVEFSFGKLPKERIYANEVCRSARALGFHAGISKAGCYHVQISSRHLADFLTETFGHGANQKRIPAWVKALPVTKLAPLVEAYLNGDGTRTRSGRLGATISRQLAYDLMLVGNKIGFRVGIRETPGGPTWSTLYTMRVIPNDPTRPGLDTFVADGFMHMRVRSISTLPVCGSVYNLEVDEDNSYCTRYHTVHNCQATGLSRRIPITTAFAKLTPASRILLVHPRARVENADAYGPFPCPRLLPGPTPRPLHAPGTPGCAGVWREDVEGGEPVPNPDPRAIVRRTPSVTYRARRRPADVRPVYTPGFFLSLPIQRLVVVNDTRGAATAAASRAGVPVVGVPD